MKIKKTNRNRKSNNNRVNNNRINHRSEITMMIIIMGGIQSNN